MDSDIELGEGLLFRGSLIKGKRLGFGELIRPHEFSLSGIWLNNIIQFSQQAFYQKSDYKLQQ